MYTEAYIRRRTLVRRLFWTPIVVAESVWIIWMLFA